MLELRSMLLKIAERLFLCVEGRRKPAHLPVSAERDEENDGAVFRFDSAHELHSPEWGSALRMTATTLKRTIVPLFLNAS